MIKKLSVATLGILLIGAIYYFTAGSEKLTNTMKAEMSTQLASLKTEGFLVENHEVHKKKEHFVLSFNETEKVAKFLKKHGAQVTAKDVEGFKGLKIGVDVSYLANAYSATSFDFYPLSLPHSITSASLDEEEKETLKQIEDMLERKVFLVHLDVNKLGTGFKGYMKDIDEVIKGKAGDVKMTMNALDFSGDLKDDKLIGVKQTLENLTLKAPDALTAKFTNFSTNYTITGNSKYDYKTTSSLNEILLLAEDGFKVQINGISMDSTSNVINDIASITADTKVASIHYTDKQKTTILDTLIFNMKANNFNIKALEKLENIDPSNEAELLATLQQLISHGVHLEIPDFSIKTIELGTQKLEGFKLTTTFDIDKSLDLSSLAKNPLAAIGAIDANLHFILSNDLFAFVATQPQAVMAMMLFQPKDVNGQKVYKVELKDGTLKVNDKITM